MAKLLMAENGRPMIFAFDVAADRHRALRVLESCCPLCDGPLVRKRTYGYCFPCDLGWAIHDDVLTRIDRPPDAFP